MTSTRNALSYHMRDSVQVHFAHFQGPLQVAKPEMGLLLCSETQNSLRNAARGPMDRNNIGTRHGFTAI
jgi:hypothetical protein